MTFDLGRRLLLSNAIHSGELLHAVFEAVVRERPFSRCLADTSSAVRAMLGRPLEGGVRAPLEEVIPHRELVRALPRGLPARLLAVPVRRDAHTGVVDVAVVDPLDRPLAEELAFHLAVPVRLVAASLEEIERAVREATIELTDPSVEETPVPLVRRSVRSLVPPAPVASIAQAVEMVLDFSASAREEREAPQPPPSRAITVQRAKPRPLDLSAIERSVDRDDLLAAIVDALLSTASAAAILAPRRGRWGGVAAAGAIDLDRVRAANVAAEGAIATAVARGDWCAPLDPRNDATLLAALDLSDRPSTEVLLHPVYVSDKPGMLVAAFGMADAAETSRRAIEIARTTSHALWRLLRAR